MGSLMVVHSIQGLSCCGAEYKSGLTRYLHQLLIPVPHLAPRIPERTIHAHEISPLPLLQRSLEIFPAHRVAPFDVELFTQLFVQRMVPSYVVAQM